MSFNFDFSQVWTQASDFANNMWPVFVIPLGIILGVGVLNFVIKGIKSAIGSF
jgi:hypothetical protein